MAGRIPQHFIDQLLNRVDVVDLIDGYVPLKKAGANYKACCPFHNEKTPSFTVSPAKQFYHCFGCGANGTAIGFLMEYDHMEFREAIEKLASLAGMEIPEESQGHTPKPKVSQGIDLYQLMDTVNEFYQQQLRAHTHKQQAIDYLKQRGISGQIAKRFGLGFAPPGWDNLMSTHGATTSAQKALLDTGMLTENDKKRVYDRFRHRIMFPIHDHRGRVVGFGGRVLNKADEQAGNPKYLNSPETPIFHKGSELYNLHGARAGIKDADGVLVVEGYMDVVALAQAGIDNAVATLGTATSSMHLQRLFRHTQNITFSFDGDRAGRAAAWKALETSLPLLQDGYQMSFLFLPDGEDPDTMVKKVGKEAFEALVRDAMPLPDFLIDTLKSQADVNRLDGRAKLSKLARPLLEKLPGGVLKKLLVDRLSLITQVSEADLLPAKAASAPPVGSTRRQAKPQAHSKQHTYITPIRRALSLILQYPQFYEEFTVLNAIPETQVRGIGTIQELHAVCAATDKPTTAILLERYRQASYFDTLMALANHAHNNKESLDDDEARHLIRMNNQRIIEDFNRSQPEQINGELEALIKKAKVTELSETEHARKQQLTEFYLNSLKS
ncbi:DNA primase [Arenicella chitinivorans]|uniref:DNA primase n=1 Tax=Arenicella chitinivorans TaxID=1329800 RepID=A0A918RUP3_9GAMM|nr:DNA primase [Arenicella chitinivorans]GHA13422.1 DNA primase [Arenicella chitinivorans]